jgi:hypothetical protein
MSAGPLVYLLARTCCNIPAECGRLPKKGEKLFNQLTTTLFSGDALAGSEIISYEQLSE